MRGGRKLKTLLVAALAVTSFTAGLVVANQVRVLNIQGLAGNRVLVPDPHLQVIQTRWTIDAPNSTITGLDLLVFPNDTVRELRLYQVLIQVSCLDPNGKEYICSTGGVQVVLPSMGVGIRPLHIDLQTTLFPETTEVHDLSFIVSSTTSVGLLRPSLFAGTSATTFKVEAGKTTLVPVALLGFNGVPAKTTGTIMLQNLPSGFHALIGDCNPDTTPCPYTLDASKPGSGSSAEALVVIALTADPTGLTGIHCNWIVATATFQTPGGQIFRMSDLSEFSIIAVL